MTQHEFVKSIQQDNPPQGLSIYLQALWQDAKGNWDTAHDLAQEAKNKKGDRIHAYLHRKEGDKSNANYWYSRTGEKMPDVSLEEEWSELVTHFLSL